MSSDVLHSGASSFSLGTGLVLSLEEDRVTLRFGLLKLTGPFSDG